MPIETRLVKYLRRWQHDPLEILADGSAIELEIACVVEYFISDCTAHGSEREQRGWWSDGVCDLRITSAASDTFNLVGATFWGCSSSKGPFEIDVFLDPEIEEYIPRCQFRMGALDRQRKLLVYDAGIPPEYVIERRPRRNAEWALAIELTHEPEA